MVRFSKVMYIFMGAGVLALLPDLAFAQPDPNLTGTIGINVTVTVGGPGGGAGGGGGGGVGFVPETVGEMLDNLTFATSDLPLITSLFSYLAGLVVATAGIFKFRDHVDNPNNTPISEGLKRIIAGGMFLSLPFMASAVKGNLMGGGEGGNEASITQALNDAGGDPGALDTLAVNFISDVAGPMETVLSVFAYIAAGAFLVLGISRLTKRMEEGPKGPAGIGTIMTFIVSGALFASGDMVGLFTTSLFGDTGLAVTPSIDVEELGVDPEDMERVEVVIQAVMMFIIIVGLIAFIRGWFVLRAFADGQQGATLAQGLTFLLGGALAINLGELINVIQATLGIEGITFS